jgi:hypothetical protein
MPIGTERFFRHDYQFLANIYFRPKKFNFQFTRFEFQLKRANERMREMQLNHTDLKLVPGLLYVLFTLGSFGWAIRFLPTSHFRRSHRTSPIITRSPPIFISPSIQLQGEQTSNHIHSFIRTHFLYISPEMCFA